MTVLGRSNRLPGCSGFDLGMSMASHAWHVAPAQELLCILALLTGTRSRQSWLSKHSLLKLVAPDEQIGQRKSSASLKALPSVHGKDHKTRAQTQRSTGKQYIPQWAHCTAAIAA